MNSLIEEKHKSPPVYVEYDCKRAHYWYILHFDNEDELLEFSWQVYWWQGNCPHKNPSHQLLLLACEQLRGGRGGETFLSKRLLEIPAYNRQALEAAYQ